MVCWGENQNLDLWTFFVRELSNFFIYILIFKVFKFKFFPLLISPPSLYSSKTLQYLLMMLFRWSTCRGQQCRKFSTRTRGLSSTILVADQRRIHQLYFQPGAYRNQERQTTSTETNDRFVSVAGSVDTISSRNQFWICLCLCRRKICRLSPVCRHPVGIKNFCLQICRKIDKSLRNLGDRFFSGQICR